MYLVRERQQGRYALEPGPRHSGQDGLYSKHVLCETSRDARFPSSQVRCAANHGVSERFAELQVLLCALAFTGVRVVVLFPLAVLPAATGT